MLPAEYKDPDVLFADIAATYKQAVDAYYAAGCRYLQLDDIFFAYLGDPEQRAQRKAMGQDPDWLIDRYAWMLNEAIKDRPADMLIGMHMCRGNFRSTYAASGGYDAAADAIFNKTDVDIYFMEYDTDRAGGLEPLRLLPKGSKRRNCGKHGSDQRDTGGKSRSRGPNGNSSRNEARGFLKDLFLGFARILLSAAERNDKFGDFRDRLVPDQFVRFDFCGTDQTSDEQKHQKQRQPGHQSDNDSAR